MSAEAWRRTGHLDAVAFCVAGVALSACEAHFAWQASGVQYLHRCPRKLGDELVTWTLLLSVWLAWHFQHVRLTLRGRRGTFSTYIVSAEAWRRSGHLDAAAFCVAGVALSACEAHFAWQAWQAWHVQCRCFLVAGVALSACEAQFAWQA